MLQGGLAMDPKTLLVVAVALAALLLIGFGLIPL
jgi:preprotein translocase subunit Sec61beta